MADVPNFIAFSRPPTRFAGALQLLYNHVIVLSEFLLNLLAYLLSCNAFEKLG